MEKQELEKLRLDLKNLRGTVQHVDTQGWYEIADSLKHAADDLQKKLDANEWLNEIMNAKN